jgi:poly-beta-1,6-N-acetyl-D-glucosamine synthase
MSLTHLVLLCTFIYAALVLYWRFHIKIQENRTANSVRDVSLVVVFRNEAIHLPELIQHLQAYQSEIEIIFVNDGSSDGGENAIVESLPQARLLNQKSLGKKAGLRLGIENASRGIIATLDADVIPEKNWLYSMRSYIEHAEFVSGPVLPKKTSQGIFSSMLALEWFSLQAVTEGSFNSGYPLMANGANSMFTKKLWNDCLEIRSDFNLASGDDMFLLEAAKKLQRKVCYASSAQAAVFTNVPDSIHSFWKQRTRWASKTPHYSRTLPQLIALLVLMIGFFQLVGWTWAFNVWLGVWTIKLLADVFVLQYITMKYQQSKLMRIYFITAVLYPLYVCAVGIDAIYAYVFKPKALNPSWK